MEMPLGGKGEGMEMLFFMEMFWIRAYVSFAIFCQSQKSKSFQIPALSKGEYYQISIKVKRNSI